MTKTVPMIRADDGKTADVHPDEVQNWQPHGWAIDQARVHAQTDEAACLEREAEERARAEAERIAAEEEAQREANAALARGESEHSAALARGGDLENEAPPWNDDDGAGQDAGPAESAAGAPVSAEGDNDASAAEARSLTVAKGPRGLFFVKAGDAIVSKGFATEEEAADAMAEIGAGEQS